MGASDDSTQTYIFGFTSKGPENVEEAMSCLYPGYWKEQLVGNAQSSIFYYTTPKGDIHFGIDDEEKGIYFSGIDVGLPLWAFVILPSNCKNVEYVNPNATKQLQTRTGEHLESGERFHGLNFY